MAEEKILRLKSETAGARHATPDSDKQFFCRDSETLAPERQVEAQAKALLQGYNGQRNSCG